MAGVTVDIGANTQRLTRGLNQGRRSLANWASRVTAKMARAGLRAGQRFVRSFTRHMRRAGIVAGGLITAGIGKSLQEAGRFEYAEFQFKALMKSAEGAKARMDEIRALDLEVPFDITQLMDGSRALEVFTGGAEAGADALRMIADAAAVTPRPFKEVAYWYGRAYAAIESGRPLGEANRRLLEMGVIGPEATQWLQMLSKNYSIEAQALKLEIIKDELKKFEGAAEELSKTWPGMMSILSSGTKQTFEAVGKAIQPLAKVWLQEVIDKMQELRDNGTLTRWGENVSAWAEKARKVVEDRLIPAFLGLKNKVESYYNEMKSVFDSGGIEAVSEKFATDAINNIIRIFKTKAPELTAVGVEIGTAIGKGLMKAMGDQMDKSWIGRRVKQSGQLVSGVAQMPGALKGRHDAIKNMTEQERRIGRVIMEAQGKSGMSGVAGDVQAQLLGQRALANPSWAESVMRGSQALHVIIDEDQTKGEEIP